MKIIIVGTAYPYRGGLAAFNERLATQFRNEGHDVEIYTFTLQYPSFLFPGTTQYSSEPAPKSLKIFRKINSCNPINWLKIGKEIRKKEADIVIIKFWLPFMAPCLGTIARLARKNHKTKVISVLDNIIPHEKRIGDYVFARYFVRSVDSFIAMSKSVFNDVNIFDNKKPKKLCPHPLYDNFGEVVERAEAAKYLNLDTNMKYILFFGIVREYKGLDLLLKAFAKTDLYDKGVRLIVAGEFYNNSEQYYVLEKDLLLEGKIEWFSKFIPDSEVKYFFSLADIVVQPYKSATQSGVTQIAYHFEKPMLVTNVGGLGEIVPDRKVGYTVNPAPEEIAKALQDFFENNRQETFTDGVIEEKKKYTWSRMTDEIIQCSDNK